MSERLRTAMTLALFVFVFVIAATALAGGDDYRGAIA
jgi:hypothetical protein